ncbi:MAG: ABC transporter ATP-binding protein [Candidatus Heimdallarchaeaceae archaeon]
MNAQIIADELVKTYETKAEKVTILKGASFKIQQGEIICLLGMSGSGKTTTLNLLAGLDKPTSGRILIEGEDIDKWTQDALSDYRLRKVGYIFQDFYLFENLTALENIMVPLLLNGKDFYQAREKGMNLIHEVGLETKVMSYPDELSSGEKKRVSVARAIANSPKILIADEPTGTLDTRTGDKIMNLLVKISKENKMTMIYTTHDPYLTNHASRLFVIKDGVIEHLETSKIDDIAFFNISFENKKVEGKH